MALSDGSRLISVARVGVIPPLKASRAMDGVERKKKNGDRVFVIGIVDLI
jgi:hypothetical protein